ncbi:MAG: sensor histidine kinase KdpD [Phycisphaerales bacterium]|nr:MAG: sensor histidine kinase KdpD [Phycisphaerales bacterium]
MSNQPRQPSNSSPDGRPDPDALLAKVSADEPQDKKGHLKIFFGYSPGVGKTYGMLEAARALEMKRGDVLAGYIEPHGRTNTETLLLGLDLIPYKHMQYRGIELKEFDLDEALQRKPKLILVDELAHTNADGCRHSKRWQDVAELLEAGIDVFTTLNVQHLESLNDVIGKISGVVVRETVPDSVFDSADEIELVDLPPDELLERFREGKVYVPDQVQRAIDRFFRKETLVALRELALRRTAEHVNRQVELGRRGLATRPIWATRERLMVAVGPSPTSARLIRATRRMATELRAPWYAVAVERPSAGAMPKHERANLDVNLRLAQSLGADVTTLHRENVPDALVDFARDRGVSRLVVGKTAEPRWKQLLGMSVVDRIVRRSGDLEVLVIRGDPETPLPTAEIPKDARFLPTKGDEFFSQMLTVSSALLMSLVCALGMREIGIAEPNIIMVFLLAVVVVAYVAGRLAASTLAVLSVLAFNFFFTRPHYTFVVYDIQYLFTFAIMLIVGLVVSGLVGRVRAQAHAAAQRADANEVLHRVSRQLATTTGRHQVCIELLWLLDDLLKLDAVVFLREADGIGPGMGDSSLMSTPNERAVATWVLEHAAQAGNGTATLHHAAAWYLPLSPGEGETVGVLGVRPKQGVLDFGMRRLLQSIAAIAAQAIERENLTERARAASVRAESERLRSDLLAAVSHDMRTPLATIGGAASTILHSSGRSISESDRALLQDIADESERLSRLVDNLIQMGRLDEGRETVAAEWFPVDEIIDAALRQVRREADSHRIRVELPNEPLLVFADSTLLTQLLFNLFDNALRYAGDGEITVRAGQVGRATRIEVLDRGPGLGDAPAKLFDRFVRGPCQTGRGVGLGLAICRAIAEAHAGSIEARNRDGGGAEFVASLPYPRVGEPPSIPGDEFNSEAGTP